MKNKTVIFHTAILLLVFSCTAFAQKHDFSGTWTLDKTKSEGVPPEIDQVLTVKQTGNNLSVETKIINGKKEQTFPKSYVLNGKEADYNETYTVSTTAETPDDSETKEATKTSKGKQTAKRTAKGIEIIELSNVDTPNGTASVKITRRLTLSPDGKILTVNINVQSPTVKSDSNLVFNKT